MTNTTEPRVTQHVLRNRVAVVTHAASEIGRGICAALREAGSIVVEADGPAEVLVRQAVERHSRLDIMVNTSVLTPGAPAETTRLETFADGIEANLSAIFFGCQHAARQMIRQAPAGGVIVNISSVGGVVALPGQAAYCSAMAGVNAITKILATEWAVHGVRVVGLGAGLSRELVDSLMPAPTLLAGANELRSHRRIPPQALLYPADVGQAIVYLASDAARHVNGTTLYVDGGWLADGYWE